MSKKEELELQGFKTYENEEIRVFWNPKMCQHAGKCVPVAADLESDAIEMFQILVVFLFNYTVFSRGKDRFLIKNF